MELEQIISTVTSQLGETPLSARSISDFVNANLPAQGTEPDDAYFAGIVNSLKVFGNIYKGQHNHETAEARKTWETEWQKNHPTTTPTTPSTPPTGGLTEEKVAKLIADAIAANKPQQDPAISQMQQTLTQMQQAMTAREDAAKIQVIKDSVSAQLSKMDDVNAGILAMAIQQTEVKADSKIEDVVKLVTASYETINKSIFGDSAKPLGGSGGNNQSGVADYLKSLAESNKRLAEARAAAAAQYK